MMKYTFFLFLVLVSGLLSCDKNDDNDTPVSKDINSAPRASIDRFSASAGKLMLRDATNGLPGANVSIPFDQPPFITTGLDRTGDVVHYYNFDIQSTTPSPIYVFFHQSNDMPVNGQHNVVATIPGDVGYNDFWLVNKVMVPDQYVPNSLTDEGDILSSGHTIEPTNIIVNCPVVPFGSTAFRSKTPGTSSTLTLGWYKDQSVAYFNFDEASLATTSNNMVPVSPIYVMFNDNAAGPASGFLTESGNPTQTHNVLATNPGDATYSPLWSVRVLDNVHFDMVSDLASAFGFPSTLAGANVNCPVVK